MRTTTLTPIATDIHTGSSFDGFLEEEGLRNEVEAAAIKKVLDWQLQQETMKPQRPHLTK